MTTPKNELDRVNTEMIVRAHTIVCDIACTAKDSVGRYGGAERHPADIESVSRVGADYTLDNVFSTRKICYSRSVSLLLRGCRGRYIDQEESGQVQVYLSL